MADSKTHQAAARGFLGRLAGAQGKGGSASVGYRSVVSFKRPERASSEDRTDGMVEEMGASELFVARSNGLMPLDPVARPKLKPRLEGAAQKIYQLHEEPLPVPVPINEAKALISKAEVDITAFLEVVSAAFPQPRDPDVRPVLKARPAEAARPFVYLPGAPEDGAGEVVRDEIKQPVWNAEAIQQAHKERELKAFHEFLDRMESAPLESLDLPLAELDEKAEVSRQYAVPTGLYDPILEAAAAAYTEHVARAAAPVPDEDRPMIVEAVIEPLDPVAKPRLPYSAAEVLPGGLPQRLSPSQRAHLKRPVTLRDRHGRIAPVTYSLNPRSDA